VYRKVFYLPCKLMNTYSVHNGKAVHLDLESINKKYRSEMSSRGSKLSKI
jgi:hypothetical protein